MINAPESLRGPKLRRPGHVIPISLFAVIAIRAVAVAACKDLDPVEVESFAKAAAAAAESAVPTSSTTPKEELADALRKARLPEAAADIEAAPGVVEEASFDFLNGGRYVKVTLDRTPAQVVQFVHQRERWIPIEKGAAGRQRALSELDISVRSAESALSYVQWLFGATSEGRLWLVDSVDDVPFMPASRHEQDLKAQIEAARKDLESKIQPPRAEASDPVYVVHQDAVSGRDLVRYTVRVSKLGLPTVETETIARNLPIVYVGT